MLYGKAQDQEDEGKEKWGVKKTCETMQNVTVLVIASQEAVKKYTTQVACMFLLHIRFSPKEFQGETS